MSVETIVQDGAHKIRFHARIIWALLMRELATRYGRDNIGFLWIIGEPVIFCVGVLIMWSIIKPPYEHGIKIVPFVITGYLPLTVMRHMFGQGIHTVEVNSGLLYHRNITILHLYIARLLLEVLGVSLAGVIIITGLISLDLMLPPQNLKLIYAGWFSFAWLIFGMTVTFGSAAAIFKQIERVVNLLTYVMIPLTGCFYMVDWIPSKFRSTVLLIPFLNCTEMFRAGFFGEFVHTYFSLSYVLYWGAGFNLLGLLLLQFVRSRIDVD